MMISRRGYPIVALAIRRVPQAQCANAGLRMLINDDVRQAIERRKAELMASAKCRGSAGEQEAATHDFGGDNSATHSNSLSILPN